MPTVVLSGGDVTLACGERLRGPIRHIEVPEFERDAFLAIKAKRAQNCEVAVDGTHARYSKPNADKLKRAHRAVTPRVSVVKHRGNRARSSTAAASSARRTNRFAAACGGVGAIRI